MKLEKMMNIGKTLATDLEAVGIKDSEDLIKLGSVKSLLLLGDVGHTCSNKLYALEGAILNVRWHDISSQHREELYKTYKEQKHATDLRD